MRFCCVIWVLVSFVLQVNAQTIGGAEIYYKLISSKKYLITAQIYRQCSDAALNGISGYVISDSFKVPMNFKRISISKINDTCGNPCQNKNSNSNPGFEKHVFIDTIDFKEKSYRKFIENGNCIVHFAIRQKLRPFINNVVQNGNPDTFYLDAMVNTCLEINQNHSPIFSLEPKLQTCLNQNIFYNMGFLDSFDLDSIALSLTPGLSDYKTPLSYSGSYSEFIPMTPYCPPNPGVLNCRALPNAKPPRGFYFDKVTGDVIFTPTKNNETGIIKVTASEYRRDSAQKYFLIGQVSREMIVTTKQCKDNNLPYFTGSNQYTVCHDNVLCITTGAKDDPFLPKQTIPDTITLSWNYGIPATTCKFLDSSAREKEIQICLNAKTGVVNSYHRFAIQAVDQQCNIGMSSRGIHITVKPKAYFNKTFQIKNCSYLHYTIDPYDTMVTPLKDFTSIVTISDITNPQKNLFYSNKRIDYFNAPKNGKYIIRIEGINKGINCPYVELDTIELKASTATISYSKDTMICQNDSLKLGALNGDFSGFKFKWYDTEIGLECADTGMIYSSRLMGLTKTIRVEISDGKSCTYVDTVKVISRGAFETNFSGERALFCRGISDTIHITNVSGTPPFSYEWVQDGINVGADSFLPVKIFSNSSLMIRVSDSSDCIAEDKLNLKIVKLPTIGMQNTVGCLNSVIKIPAAIASVDSGLQYKWFLNSKQDNQKGDSFMYKVAGTATLRLVLGNGAACYTEKTIIVDFHDLPNFTIIGDTVYNKLHKISLSCSKTYPHYMWSNGANSKDNIFWASSLGDPGMYSVTLEATDSNGCKNTQLIKLRTDGLTNMTEIPGSNFKVYPNPIKNKLNILSNTDCNYKIYTTEGLLLISGNVNAGEQQIDISSFPSGIYLLEINGIPFRIIKS